MYNDEDIPLVGSETDEQLSSKEIVTIDNSLQARDMPDLGFYPVGPRLVVETVSQDFVSEGGVLSAFGLGERPLYRIVRFGSVGSNAEVFSRFKLGDIIYSQSTQALSVNHSFPRDPETGERRRLLLFDISDVHGVIPGHHWTDEEIEEMNKIEQEKTASDFTREIIDALDKTMLRSDEVGRINLEPIGDTVIVENVPSQTMEGVVHLAGHGKHLPIFRIVKKSKTGGTNKNTSHLKEGSVVMMHGVNPGQLIPHSIKERVIDEETGEVTEVDELKSLFLVPLGLTVGYYPQLSWGSNENVVSIDVSSGVEVADGISS